MIRDRPLLILHIRSPTLPFFNLCSLFQKSFERLLSPIYMVERISEDIKSEKRQLDNIRRERDSILRLLNQARLSNLKQEVKNLIQEFDRLDAVLSEDDSY